jgi:hypothetical protein
MHQGLLFFSLRKNICSGRLQCFMISCLIRFAADQESRMEEVYNDAKLLSPRKFSLFHYASNYG